MKDQITIIIPVYNNAQLLVRTLKANLPHFGSYHVVIVDDASTEDIKGALQEVNFQGEYIKNRVNVGFGATVNKAAMEVKTPYILLLNSDVILLDRKFFTLTKWFERDRDLFAVSVKQREKDGSLGGKNSIYFEHGMIRNTYAKDLDTGLTAWAEAGSCMVSTEKYKKLGGFSPLYSPFYHEDIDLSYRAYKRGWKSLFDGQVVVEHHHESTIGKYYTKKQVARIALRNHLLFMWGNTTDKSLCLQHIISLPQLFWSAFRSGLGMSILDAIVRYPLVGHHRAAEKKYIRRTDREVLSLFSR